MQQGFGAQGVIQFKMDLDGAGAGALDLARHNQLHGYGPPAGKIGDLFKNIQILRKGHLVHRLNQARGFQIRPNNALDVFRQHGILPLRHRKLGKGHGDGLKRALIDIHA